jgi:hypothetical protein
MKLIPKFDPSLYINNPDGGIITTNGINANEQLVLYNDSLCAIELFFQDQSQDILPPSWCKDWVREMPMGDIKFTIPFTLNLTGNPISLLYGVIYEDGEHIPSINSPMQRSISVGNNEGINVSTTNSLVNNGNAADTTIIESTVSGQSTPSVTLTNDGLLQLSVISNALIQLIKTQTADPLLILGAASHILQVLSTLELTSGVITTNNTQVFNSSGYDTFIGARGTNNVLHLQAGGTDLVTISNTLFNVISTPLKLSLGDLQIGNGKLVFNDGSHVSRMHGFSGTGSGTFNHNCGTTPNLIMLTTANPGGGSQTLGYNPSTLTSTTVDVTAGAGLPWVGLAIVY